MLRAGVVRETAPGETRVAVVPDAAAKLSQAKLEVLVEAGAGLASGHSDESYREAHAQILPDARAVYAGSDVVLKVREPREAAGGHEADLLREGSVLIGFLDPTRNTELIERLAARQITAFAMELVPRISRAQKMDALSSMSTVAGYKAALIGANSLGKFFPLLMTAAGTIAPAHVFVLGAGVAGLQAIATARRLGAVVEAFDVRPAARDEVKSLGAKFVALEMTDEKLVGEGGYARALTSEQEARERELIHAHVKTADLVITTAMVPGRRAPLLITEGMVRDMMPGAVIVDMGAEMGGNCELTQPGATVIAHGVTIHGPINLAATLPVHASQMYSRNVLALLTHLVKDGKLTLDYGDEITRESCLVRGGAESGASPAATSAPQAADPLAAGRAS